MIRPEDLKISIFRIKTDQIDCYSYKHGVEIEHVPTGVKVRATTERDYFANRAKAVRMLENRLDKKLVTHLGVAK